jgi:hypothetical protein
MPFAPCRFLAAALIACATPLAAAQAAAADQRAAGPALEEGQAHAGPKLTGAALRHCVRLDRDIAAIDTEVRILKGPVEAAEWTHQLRARRLDSMLATLDRGDADAIARYNREVDEHAEAVQAYNALLPGFNAVVARQNTAVDEFNGRCAERAYYKKAWWAIESELREEAAGR